MSSYVKYPTINPIRMFQDGRGSYFYDNQASHEYQDGYQQPFEVADTLHLQFQVAKNGANISAVLNTAAGVYVKSMAMFQVPGGPLYTGYYNYVLLDDFSGCAEGYYQLVVTIQKTGYDDIVLLSEPLHIKTSHDDTILLKYTHSVNDFDIIFTEDTQYFNMRVHGGIGSDGVSPGGKYTMFQDLQYNPVMLQAIPFSTYKYIFGSNRGIPNYLIEKINLAFCLDYVFILDERFGTEPIGYARNEGAKPEPLERDHNYPLTTWSMELLKTDNSYNEAADFELFTVDLTYPTVDDETLTVDQLYI